MKVKLKPFTGKYYETEIEITKNLSFKLWETDEIIDGGFNCVTAYEKSDLLCK
jgi:hypothetical protein